ncbi:hypothetical protein ACUZ8Y_01720 [Aeromonas veronii]|uniref:hypothetical protein n=1 Tax=Aeromonas veronii TaxID=654 RepID=UPI00406BBDF9
MLKIEYNAKSFPKSIYGGPLQGKKTLITDWHEVVWAAITVGKRNSAQISSHGALSLYEIINRSTLVWLTLKQNANKLEKSSVYTYMDPTEKTFVSFSLGMIMSKLFALRLLGIPWLEHVSSVNSSVVTKTQTKSRPDLIGLNKRKEYIIFEAKGRSNNFDSAVQAKAKNQTKVIHKIVSLQPGSLQPVSLQPVLRVACQSYFNNSLEVCIEDPDDIQEEPINIEISEIDYFESYYSIFKSILITDQSLLKKIGIQIAFSSSLHSALKKRKYEALFNVAKKKDVYFDKDGFKCFPDGLKIKLDPTLWGDELLAVEPDQR